MPKNKVSKSGKRHSEGERLWEIFKYSVQQMAGDMERMRKMRNTLDASIDDNVWPTISKIPLAEGFSTVENMIGPCLDYLIPPMPFVNILPMENVDKDTMDKVSWALYSMMVYRMRLKRAIARSIRDTFSVSVGYGIVEPITVTPPASREIVAGRNRTRQMTRGTPVRSLRYRYISSGKCVPYPSGTDFNGDDATPFAFLLDAYPEWQFRRLFDKKTTDGEDIRLKGDPDEIIEACRAAGFVSQMDAAEFADDMGGGRRQIHGTSTNNELVPVIVPVLKCYEDGKHTWLFCGAGRNAEPQVVFEDETYAATRKPLVKWDPWLDSDRWFPMSQPEADMRYIWAKNLWFNAVFDLFTQNIQRPLVYDSSTLDENEAKQLLQPRGMAGATGSVRDIADFMKPPGIDASTFQWGDVINAQRARLTGERDLSDKNFTRGGSMAFQDLVNSLSGKERLRNAMLQMGGLESVAWQTLIYMQVLGSALDLTFTRPAYRDGEDYMEQFEVTEDDMRHAYDLIIDLDNKNRLGSMDASMKLQLYAAKRDNPFIDQYEAVSDLYFDETTLRRQRLSREEVQRKQAEREQAEMEGLRAGTASTGGPQQVPAVAGATQGGR